jgi:hypothetical protein
VFSKSSLEDGDLVLKEHSMTNDAVKAPTAKRNTQRLAQRGFTSNLFITTIMRQEELKGNGLQYR